MRPRAGARRTVEPAFLDARGDGVSTEDGLEVHAPGLFIGERAEVELLHVSRHHPRARARVAALLRPHPERRAPPCPQQGACAGCPLMPLEIAAQRAQKRETLRRVYKWPIEQVEHGDEEFGYRWSSKRVAFGGPGELRLGSYARGSHDPVDMRGCLVDHPAIVAAADELAALARRERVLAYDERARTGDLRYAWFKTDGSDVLVTLITAAEDSHAARALPPLLTRAAGVAWSVQPGAGNAIRGAPPRPLRGRATLALTLAGVTLEQGPLGFLQPNPRVAARAYRALIAGPDGAARTGAHAIDLYAGAGITTALLRERFTRVTPCESYPESARELGVAPETVEAFLRRRAASAAREPVDLIVANPPRGGMGRAVCELLADPQLAAPQLHVMSCSAEALAADLQRLTERAGQYRLLRVRAFDTLPQTAHVELVAWLERARPHAGA